MKIKILTGLVGLALLVPACSSNSEPAPKETVYVQQDSAPQAPQESESEKNERVYLEIIREELASAQGVPDATILELGHNICNALDDGATLNDIGEVGMSAGMSAYDIGFIVGAATAAFCPQHSNLVNDMGATYS